MSTLQYKHTEQLVETNIRSKILFSRELSLRERDTFLNILPYFTTAELEELKGLL